MIFFLICLFFGLFSFSFFLPVYMCLCVLSFRLGVGGVFLLALTFHWKHGPGAGCVTPTQGRRSKAWEEIFLIPDTRTVPDKCPLDPLVLIPQRNGLQGTCRA